MSLKRVLVAIPHKAGMNEELLRKMRYHAEKLVHSNPGFDVKLCYFDKPFSPTPGQVSIYDRVAQARNALVDEFVLTDPTLDYVFWIDADLFDYAPDTLTRLANANPTGVTAPLVLIEPTGAQQDNWFYDVAAFVEHGQPVYTEGPHFGNVAHRPPYFVSTEDIVDCDSVGCSYLIPAAVHRSGVRFYPTAFTDHFPVVQQAKQMGMRVCCVRYVVMYHAFLPKYGEKWHAEPMEPWKDFDFAKHGLTTTPGTRPDCRPPSRQEQRATIKRHVVRGPKKLQPRR